VAAIDELMASAPPEEQKRLAAFREAAISLGARALADLVAKTAGL
jgi:hypothetical protein